jgi:hypothetical protein
MDRSDRIRDPLLSETRENCRAILTYNGNGAANISHLLRDRQSKNHAGNSFQHKVFSENREGNYSKPPCIAIFSFQYFMNKYSEKAAIF